MNACDHMRQYWTHALSEPVNRGDGMTSDYDITDRIGPLYMSPPEELPEWPMYSYSRPAYILWNAIASELDARGWTETQIKDWLQSKAPRLALDGALGTAIQKLGEEYAKGIDK